MKTLVTRFVKDESGATAIEYGLIAAGISVAIITVVQGLGTKLNTTFTQRAERAQLTSRSANSERLRQLPEPFRFATRTPILAKLPQIFTIIARQI